MAYNPSLHTTSNKPLGISGIPTDARSQYFDESKFMYRDYASIAEVLGYLVTATNRRGKFPIYINATGTLNGDGTFTGGTVEEYWFKDGVADVNLILKTSGASSSETGATIKTKLETLTGEDRLDASAVKNLPAPTDLTDVNSDITTLQNSLEEMQPVVGEAGSASIKLDRVGGRYPLPITQSANLSITLDGATTHQVGGGCLQPIISNGINTIVLSSAFTIRYPLNFGVDSANNTPVVFPAGYYQLYFLMHEDGKVTVNIPAYPQEVITNNPPTASAGNDQSISLPTDSVVLTGAPSDSDGSVSSVLWTQQIGPNTATLSGDTTNTLTVSNLVEGTYSFRFTVTDNLGATSYDEVMVTVNPVGATQLSPVTNFTAVPSQGAIFLSWTDGANETGYEIENSTDSATWSPVTVTAADATSYNSTGLTPSTLYYHRIRRVGDGTTYTNSGWVTAQATTPTPSNIVVSENFDAAQIDATKLIVTNDNPTVAQITQSGGTLNMLWNGGTAGGTNQVDLKEEWQIGSGCYVFRINKTGTGVSPQAVQILSGVAGVASITISESGISPGAMRIQIYDNGTKIQEIPNAGSLTDRFLKVYLDPATHEISLWYWRTDVTPARWEQISLDETEPFEPVILDFGSTTKLRFRATGLASSPATGTEWKIDDLYVTNENFSTQYPV